jgi:DNA-binding CsgD family transcriptional regulator
MQSDPSTAPARSLLVPANALAAAALKPPDRLLDPLLTGTTLTLLHGPRGLGKTFVSLGIAWAVASGGSFLGWQAPEPRRVIYIDGEMPAFDMSQRLRLFGEPPPLLEFLMADLYEGLPDFGEVDGLNWLLRNALLTDDEQPRLRPALLVLDNLASLVGQRTNDPDRWGALQQFLVAMRRRGVAALIVHHTNKRGLQRGTSRREDVLDLVLGLRRPPDYKPSDGCHFDLHFEKARGLQGDVTDPIRARLMTDGQGTARWHWQTIEHRELERAIVHFRDGFSADEVAELLGVSRSTAFSLRRRAIDLGLLPEQAP